jgi:3-methyladenine DNA glycosylase AlkD
MKTVQREIRRSLETHVDEKYRDKIRVLVPSGSPILGVRVPTIRTLVKPFHDDHPDLTVEEVCELVSVQFAGKCREEMLFGIFLLVRFKKTLTPSLWPDISAWIDCIDNWEVCDQLAMNIAAPLASRAPALVLELVKWTRSDNPWRRRFAVACSAALNQRGRSLAAETLKVCAGLLDEKDAGVRKAVGWALREACKSDQLAVFDLLHENRTQMSRTILREGAQKLSSQQRADLGL